MTTHLANAQASISLAMTQRRLSWFYRGLLAAEGAERIERRDYFAREARRLWRGAKDNLSWARHYRELEERKNG